MRGKDPAGELASPVSKSPPNKKRRTSVFKSKSATAVGKASHKIFSSAYGGASGSSALDDSDDSDSLMYLVDSNERGSGSARGTGYDGRANEDVISSLQ